MENEFHKQMAEDFTCLDNPTKLHGSQGIYKISSNLEPHELRLLFYAFLKTFLVFNWL